MRSSLLLQQCPACLVRLTWIVFVMGGRWPYSRCFVGCCRQDLFSIARSIYIYILTPPQEQDAAQGQFVIQSLPGLNPEIFFS